MTEYSELVKALREYSGCRKGEIARITSDAAAAIEALETEIRESMQKCAECRENEPNRGEWVYLYEGNYKCSVCGEWYGVDETPLKSGMNYCPNCGAKMMEEEE